MSDGWTHADIIAIFNVLAALAVGIAIVYATVRGPVLAARQADERRGQSEVRSSKMWVFRQLMGHRYDVMQPNFVQAFNLIQVEFSDSPQVIKAFENFIEAHGPVHNTRADLSAFRTSSKTRLLNAIGASLGYDLEQLDLMEKVYSPQGWVDVAGQQAIIRQMLVDIAEGKRQLPVLNIVPDVFLEDIGGGKFAIKVKQVR